MTTHLSLTKGRIKGAVYESPSNLVRGICQEFIEPGHMLCSTNAEELKIRFVVLECQNGLVVIVTHDQIRLCPLNATTLNICAKYTAFRARQKMAKSLIESVFIRVNLARQAFYHCLKEP